MKATTLLLSHHRRIQRLVTSVARERAAREERTSSLIEAIVAHIATEENVLYPTAERELAIDLRQQRASHVRARLALFRFATSAIQDDSFTIHLSSLDRAMRDHALGESHLVRRLENEMSESVLYRLGEKMLAFENALVALPAFSLGKRQPAPYAPYANAN